MFAGFLFVWKIIKGFKDLRLFNSVNKETVVFDNFKSEINLKDVNLNLSLINQLYQDRMESYLIDEGWKIIL